MQRKRVSQNKGKNRKGSRIRAALVLTGLILAVLAVLYGALSIVSKPKITGVTATLMPCANSDTLRPFGKNLLYYDGFSLQCISDTGSVRWTFQLGSSGGYDCTDTRIAAWTGPNLYVIDQNGEATYNDNLGEEVQFARIGDSYVAAVIGDLSSSRVLIKDHYGAHADEEADAYTGLYVLDLGFYGPGGRYMWSLATDVFGTVPNTMMKTFEVGKMNTGDVSLGKYITYSVFYDNTRLWAVNTRRMRAFNDKGTEDAAASVLVYGWKLIDREITDKNGAFLLLAPNSQTETEYNLHELRFINGAQDRRYSLPENCVGAKIYNRNIYAVSDTKLYRAGMNDSRFTAYDLPMDSDVTRMIGILANGKAVVASGEEVYSITLPQTLRQAK